MGCDYYFVTALEVFYENTQDFIVIEKEKGYYRYFISLQKI